MRAEMSLLLQTPNRIGAPACPQENPTAHQARAPPSNQNQCIRLNNATPIG